VDKKNAKTELKRIIYGQNKVLGLFCKKFKLPGLNCKNLKAKT
jgi:hypothetical protein